MQQSPYSFRPVTRDDLALLRRWRAEPHVAEWWGPPEVESEEEKLGRVAMWIVALGDRPFAFAQDYSPHDWDPHPFAHLPTGSRRQPCPRTWLRAVGRPAPPNPPDRAGQCGALPTMRRRVRPPA